MITVCAVCYSVINFYNYYKSTLDIYQAKGQTRIVKNNLQIAEIREESESSAEKEDVVKTEDEKKQELMDEFDKDLKGAESADNKPLDLEYGKLGKNKLLDYLCSWIWLEIYVKWYWLCLKRNVFFCWTVVFDVKVVKAFG